MSYIKKRIDRWRFDKWLLEKLSYDAISVKDGRWGDPKTWLKGKVPKEGDNVLCKHTIQLTETYGDDTKL